MRGWFITFEGGEGAGKSTMLERSHRWLLANGHTVIKTREPGGTELAEKIRAIVLDQENTVLCPTAELLLVFAARAQHLHELIRPALKRGDTVLCDRFTDASWAYQGGGRGMPAETIAALEKAVHGDLQPDLTLLLDLPVRLGMERVADRGNSDRIERESAAFFDRVRQSYLARAAEAPGRFAVIDASLDEESVWQQVETALQQRCSR
ncbi:MAG TPA: dTMP kinase [Xanthomonadales bacterium]|nr:dTMP kinase [Xanthomonadales bacterium]